jgi:phage-related protein
MSDTFANNVATTDRVLAAQIRQVFNDQITADIDPVDIGAVASTTTGITGASRVTNMVTISLANYNALSPKDPNTVYIIV